MSVREYIGARYVPEFGRRGETSIAWDNAAPYEPLTIVQYMGNSYTSRQYVPAGIGAPNENPTFWALTGNYNAQIEAYRNEVQQFSDDIVAATDTANDAMDAVTLEATNRQAADATVLQDATALVTAETTAREAADTAITEAYTAADNALNTSIENLESVLPKVRTQYGQHMICIGDSYGRGTGGTLGEGWPYHLAAALKCASYLNISNGSAGYTQGGTTGELAGMKFIDQIQYAYEHLPSGRSASDYTLLVIGGGYNDTVLLSDESGLGDAVVACITRAHNLFPNARIVVATLCSGRRPMTEWRQRIFGLIMYSAARQGAAVLGNAPYYLYPWAATATASDDAHPNAQGYSYLGGMMACDIAGGDYMPYTTSDNSQGFALGSGVTNMSFVSRVQQGMVVFGGEVKFTYNSSSDLYSRLVTVPEYARPSTRRYFLGFMYANSDNQGWIRMSVSTAGVIGTIGLDVGGGVTWSDGTEFSVYIPTQTVPLGNGW